MYKLIENPNINKDYGELTKKQAKDNLQWFIENKHRYVKNLEKYINEDGIDVTLDYSISSLIEAWRWLESKMGYYRYITLEEYSKLKDTTPYLLDKHFSLIPKDMYIRKSAYDFSVYFGEVMIKSFPKLHWGIAPSHKDMTESNKIVLTGFWNDIYMYIYGDIIALLTDSFWDKTETTILKYIYKLISTLDNSYEYTRVFDRTRNESNLIYTCEMGVLAFFSEVDLFMKGNIEILQKFLNKHIEDLKLDYSLSSLVRIWEWFENWIKVSYRTEDELNIENKNRPVWMFPLNRSDFRINDYKIAYDISYYFAEIMIKNNSNIEWSYIPKICSTDLYNRPVLVRKKNKEVRIWPFGIIKELMEQSLKQKNPEAIKEAYYKWEKELSGKNK